MQVIVDSAFIMHCLRKDIDFISEFESNGFLVRFPREVLQELKDVIVNNKASRTDRNNIRELLKKLEDHKRFKIINVGQGKISHWLLKKENEGYLIASNDADIRHKLKKKVIPSHQSGKISFE